MDVRTLPFVTALEHPIAGAIKAVPGDFVVDEIPAYTPSGEGEHLFVRFEKTGLDTERAVGQIARALGVKEPPGYAGLKDRHARTTQWASFQRGDRDAALGLALDGIRVLEAARHGNKLRTGHLTGNRFTLRLRGADPARLDDATRTLATLAESGVPAFFGEQRFGRGGATLTRAREWIVGDARPPRAPFERKLHVSAVQSAIFNELCASRVAGIGLGGVMPGDLCRKEDSGGMFVATDLEEARARAARFEISATGPMFGAEMRWPEGEARAAEEEALARAGLDQAKLERFRRAGEGTRRPYRFRLSEPRVEADEHGLVLSFVLPAGAYATVVLRELTREAGA
ncbi:MAG: tRNA pseudouridine(13) synthase TruD [Sandaracinus sp.]